MSVNSPSRPPRLPALLRGAALLLAAAICLGGCGAGSSQPPTVQVTSHSVTLSWVASGSSVSGYAIYRSSGDPTGPYYPLAITLPNATQYVDTTVVPGQSYFYTVTSYDSANLQSLPTLAVSATIPSN
jgi:hypothetical protein